MKKIYSIIISTLIMSAELFAQSPPVYQWMKVLPTGTTYKTHVAGTATDVAGNVYATGWFEGTVAFGGTYTFSASGGRDFFIAKYDPTGTILWVNQFGGTGPDEAFDIKIDNSSNIYICGNNAQPGLPTNIFDFDPGPGVASPSPWRSAFIAKYDQNGNYIWAVEALNFNEVYSVTVDKFGNVFGFGSGSTTAMMIEKYNSSGVFVNAANITSTSNMNIGRVTSDTTGNVYAAFGFRGTVTCGSINSTSAGLSDLAIVKYNNILTSQWIHRIGGTSDDYVPLLWSGPISYGIDLTIDNQQNLCCASAFRGIVNFGPSTFNAGSSDNGFFGKFNTATGACIFVKHLSGSQPIKPSGIRVDANDNIHVSGTFNNNMDCDPGPGTAIFSGLDMSVFYAKYDMNGNYISNGLIANATSSYHVSTDHLFLNSSSIFLSGEFNGTEDFDMGAGVANQTNTAGSAGFGYFAKYDYCSAAPTQPSTISGATTICSGTTNTYSITAVAGATSYTWTLPSGWTGTSTTNSINATASATSGNITVTANNACGNSTAQTLAITVNSTPATPGTISGTATICSGTTNTYSITAVAGATSYTWTLPSGWTGTSTTNSINATASTTSGNITVTANNACGNSTAQTLAVVVNTIPSTPGTISGTATICSGTTNTYSITTVAGATSYTWTLPGGWTGTSTTNSINATASATSGNITVTANNACGNSTAQTLAVTVNSIPATPGTISGTTTICSGTTNTYSITAVAGATSYSWTLPGGWTGTSTTNSINATASATSGNITVTANNTCGNSTAQTLAVAVNTTPATPGTISGTATICSGTTNTYSVTAVAGATSYTWTLPGGWTGTSTTNSINTIASSTSGNITVTANNACGNSSTATLAIVVNTTPATPGTISGLASMCIGTGAQTYSVTAVGGATSYTWTLPATWSGTSTTNSIVATPGTSGGNITVTANNTCGNSSPQTLAVTVNPLPVVTYSQSPALVCINATSVALGTVSPTGGTFTGTAVTGSTFNASTAGTGTFTITYTYTDGNGCVNSANSNITVDPCTGISQNTIGNEIVIYPNPTNGVIIIHVVSSSGVENKAEINIYNVLGEIVYSTTSSSEKTEIDLSKEKNGIYFIKIITDKGTVTKRIIKN